MFALKSRCTRKPYDGVLIGTSISKLPSHPGQPVRFTERGIVEMRIYRRWCAALRIDEETNDGDRFSIPSHGWMPHGSSSKWTNHTVTRRFNVLEKSLRKRGPRCCCVTGASRFFYTKEFTLILTQYCQLSVTPRLSLMWLPCESGIGQDVER